MSDRIKFKYIAIEGVIGAGKTTLAKMLHNKILNSKLFLEEFEDNAFLERFYEDRTRYAFQTQMSFLTSRYRQQLDLRNYDLFFDYIITDYIFDKDKIFAYLNLQEDELKLYEAVVSFMDKNIILPDLVVYLQSSTDRLINNINLRKRSFERKMSVEYISELCESYNYFFFRYRKTPLIILNVNDVDFVNEEIYFDEIFNILTSKSYTGTHLFKIEKK